MENSQRARSCFCRYASLAALLYSPRSESQFTMRCLDEKFEEFNVTRKIAARQRPAGSGARGYSGRAVGNSERSKRANARGEKDNHSRWARAECTHGGVARQSGNRDRK